MAISDIAIPLSALFAPSPSSPAAVFPSPSFALLGPLPPTSPLHLALNYIVLSELPEYAMDGIDIEDASKTALPRRERALIITGSRALWTTDLLEEDEDHLRKHGSEYSTLNRLKRIDTRTCPTAAHLKLLLTLLGSTAAGDPIRNAPEDAVHLDGPPGLIVLWDTARLFMEETEADENRPPGSIEGEEVGEWTWKHSASLSDYMEVLAAAKAVREHFSTLRPSTSPTQLIILEPHLDRLSTLPILKPTSDIRQGLATPTRNKRLAVKAGMEWLFGDIVGTVEREGMVLDGVAQRYAVTLPKEDEVFHAVRRQCAKDAFSARSRTSEGEYDDQAWRWEWVE